MDDCKLDFLRAYFEQIESQIQFGDNKASLLIAGDSILLAVSGGLMKLASGCEGDEFAVACIVPSILLDLAVLAAALLLWGLVCALLAIRPAKIHDQPPRELFLFSYVAHMNLQEFQRAYKDASSTDLSDEALRTIHGKAGYATQKFRWLKRAVDATLASLGSMAATAIVAAVQVLSK